MLRLELGKIYERMKDLEKENKTILQRWLKKINKDMLIYENKLDAHAKALEFQSTGQVHLETRICEVRKQINKGGEKYQISPRFL
ncbi:9321_t:CDS:2 [Cetraspora pellucida]|uniref:9321_t:CDS:1 n=1 Tax=Cetraspora pellucida TaxID=1433469 RepID=A0ACA9JWJ1_9GLOM|nr:9321_t:CDS:2 [Cetraspora pellucida]